MGHLRGMIRDGRVDQAILDEHGITVTGLGDPLEEQRQYRAVTPSQGDPELLPLLEEQDVDVIAREPSGVSVLSYLLPWIILLAFYFWLQRRMLGQISGGPGAGGLGGLLSGRFAKSPIF